MGSSDPARRLRLAFVVPWASSDPAFRWVWEFLPADGDEGVLLEAAPDHLPDGPGRSRLPPYLRELFHLARRRPPLESFDVVFAWELRCALATALLRRLQRARRSRFVAVGPILKGPVLKALPLVRLLLADADRIVCFASSECEAYARLLRLPRERFVFLPTPWWLTEAPEPRDGGYLLALGQSNRDYATLLRAVEGTGLPLTIVAGDPSSLGGVEPPPGVTVRYNTGFHETNALIAGASLHCVPLHDAGFSSGQTVLLHAMTAGKACVVSDTAGVRDYVRDGETALLVPPADPEALRAALLRLWNDPALRRRIGETAQRMAREEFAFPRFSARLAQMARELTPPAR